MSALPETDGEDERFPRLTTVGEDTEDITKELAFFHRWALAHTAMGEFGLAKENYQTILANLNGDVIARASILLEKAGMHELCEERWPAYQDYERVLELLADASALEGAAELMARTQEASARLRLELDELSTAWPVPEHPIYINSNLNTYVIGEHGAD